MVEDGRTSEQAGVAAGRQTATLAGGCFWCLEPLFAELRGVERVVPGYSGGARPNPTYQQVCTGATGHAEAVQITFDPAVVGYRELLEVFFAVHDPTTPNRQGADRGTQYRSAVFCHSEDQRETALEVIRALEAEGLWGAPFVTEVVPFQAFYPAEEVHREYFRRNPEQRYCQVVIEPKVAKFRQRFLSRLKAGAAGGRG